MMLTIQKQKYINKTQRNKNDLKSFENCLFIAHWPKTKSVDFVFGIFRGNFRMNPKISTKNFILIRFPFHFIHFILFDFYLLNFKHLILHLNLCWVCRAHATNRNSIDDLEKEAVFHFSSSFLWAWQTIVYSLVMIGIDKNRISIKHFPFFALNKEPTKTE